MGIGSVLNLQGHLYDYNASDDPDGIAIGHDWKVTGQDMQHALTGASSEMETKQLEAKPINGASRK